VASAGPYASLHQHPTTQFFTGRMPFLPPNQQRQSTEGRSTEGRYTALMANYVKILTAGGVLHLLSSGHWYSGEGRGRVCPALDASSSVYEMQRSLRASVQKPCVV